jgi:hypothetical protein
VLIETDTFAACADDGMSRIKRGAGETSAIAAVAME